MFIHLQNTHTHRERERTFTFWFFWTFKVQCFILVFYNEAANVQHCVPVLNISNMTTTLPNCWVKKGSLGTLNSIKAQDTISNMNISLSGSLYFSVNLDKFRPNFTRVLKKTFTHFKCASTVLKERMLQQQQADVNKTQCSRVKEGIRSARW